MIDVREATAQFTIRYRCGAPGGAAFIVDDRDGAAYLLHGGLQARQVGADASRRLTDALARSANWTPVPAVAPYTLSQLRQLAGAPAGIGVAAAPRRPSAGR